MKPSHPEGDSETINTQLNRFSINDILLASARQRYLASQKPTSAPGAQSVIYNECYIQILKRQQTHTCDACNAYVLLPSFPIPDSKLEANLFIAPLHEKKKKKKKKKGKYTPGW